MPPASERIADKCSGQKYAAFHDYAMCLRRAEVYEGQGDGSGDLLRRYVAEVDAKIKTPQQNEEAFLKAADAVRITARHYRNKRDAAINEAFSTGAGVSSYTLAAPYYPAPVINAPITCMSNPAGTFTRCF
jgi:hypothetical protein